MPQQYDRFNLEEEIQNVWYTEKDLDSILYRIMDAHEGPPSEDDITNMLLGLKEIHNSRCIKLWDVFETMVEQDCFKSKEVPIEKEDFLDEIVYHGKTEGYRES
jgi:hypothetical protein